jgi:hypothetical protein
MTLGGSCDAENGIKGMCMYRNEYIHTMAHMKWISDFQIIPYQASLDSNISLLIHDYEHISSNILYCSLLLAPTHLQILLQDLHNITMYLSTNLRIDQFVRML